MAHGHLLDPYVEGNGALHVADPRLKLTGALSFVFAVSLLPRGAAAGFLSLLCLALVAVSISRLPLQTVVTRAAPAFLFAAMVAVGALLQRPEPGEHGLKVLWLTVSVGPAGIARFVDILARAALSSVALGLYLAVTRFPDTVIALSAIGLPAPLTSTISLTYRYLFVLAEEAIALERARRARTLRQPSLSQLLQQARVTGGMAGSLFLRSHGRSERVYQAMLSRGYHGDHRGLNRMVWQRTDTALLGLWLAALALAVTVAALA